MLGWPWAMCKKAVRGHFANACKRAVNIAKFVRRARRRNEAYAREVMCAMHREITSRRHSGAALRHLIIMWQSSHAASRA